MTRMVPLRLGVAGCGRIFETSHLPAILAGKEWHWIIACDPAAGRRRWVREHFPWVEVVSDFATMLDRRPIDGLLLATPPTVHLEQLKKAVQHGIPVLVEKPLAVSARKLSDFNVHSSGSHLVQIGFNRRFKNSYRKLHQLIRRLPGEEMNAPLVVLKYDFSNWKAVTNYLGKDDDGGGIWDDVLSHQVDLVHWLWGKPTVEATVLQAAGTGSNPQMLIYRLRLNDGLSVHCLAGHNHRFQEMVVVRQNQETIMTLPDRLVRTRNLPLPLISIMNQVGSWFHHALRRATRRPSESAHSYARQLTAFAANVWEGFPNRADGAATFDDGLCNVMTIQACRKSLAAGRKTISIEP